MVQIVGVNREYLSRHGEPPRRENRGQPGGTAATIAGAPTASGVLGAHLGKQGRGTAARTDGASNDKAIARALGGRWANGRRIRTPLFGFAWIFVSKAR